MFFKNLAVFKLPKNWPDNTGILEAQLSTKPLQPCGTHAGYDAGVKATKQQIINALQ